MSVQFWPIIAVVGITDTCEFGRIVGIEDNESDEPCSAAATGHGDLLGVNLDGQPEEVHLHLCRAHYATLESGHASVWVAS